MLFRPFRLEFWLVLGFAAFLAHLGEGGTSFRWPGNLSNDSSRDIGQTVHNFLHRPFVLLILGAILGVVVVLATVLGWVSARGQFIFLDDVLHGRASIVEPWKRFKRIGNSLFLFQLLVGLGIVAVFVLMFGHLMWSVFLSLWRETAFPEINPWLLLAEALIAFPLWLGGLVFFVLTRHFVVPVMWKYDLAAPAAWRRFWPLLTRRAGAFAGYLIFLIGIGIVLAAVVVVAGLCTCCIGFILLALPYVGSVIMLPAWVPWRLLGPEFLAQFGPEWDVQPATAAPES